MYSFVLLLNWYMYIYTTYKLLLCYINYFTQTIYHRQLQKSQIIWHHIPFLKKSQRIYSRHICMSFCMHFADIIKRFDIITYF